MHSKEVDRMAKKIPTEEEHDFLLNEMQEKFCLEYVSDPKSNATQAAIRAGYAEKSARVKASQLLTKGNIKARIRELRREALEKSGYDKDSVRELVMRRLAAIVSTNVTDVIQISPDRNDPNRDEILEELARLHGGQNMIDFGEMLIAPTSNMPEEVTAALKSLNIKQIPRTNAMSVEVDLHDPIAAAKLLAEITGLKSPEVQVNVSIADRMDKARERVKKNVGSADSS